LIDPLRTAENVTAEELDALPFGAIVLDFNGTVLSYNRHESELSGLDPARVIGKNFYRDIAPCTAVGPFRDRLSQFAGSGALVSTRFEHRFEFERGPVDVKITFVLKPHRREIMIAVERS
jgi:photoactive yellow protein